MDFELFNVPRIVFGRGKFARLGEIVAPMGGRALVVQNVNESLVARTKDVLGGSNVSSEFVRQRGEPTVEHVDVALNLAKERGCDVVIGVGGGSAIDSAKAVAALLTNGGSALDYMEVVGKGLKITKPSAPWVAVPTTAGTGAEVTRNAVVGYPEKNFKASIRSELMLARVAVVDAELHVPVRPEVTARSGMDALCQCIESYTSKGANPMTDALAIKGVELAARSLRRAFNDGTDLDAREDMAMAAMISGVTLTNAGLGAVHGFAAPLGASFPVPHGTVCAALLPWVIRANVHAADDRLKGRYRDVARAFGFDGGTGVDRLIDETARLVKDLAIPALREFGIEEKHVPEQVALAKKASSMRFNPVPLSDGALSEILLSGIRGAS